MKKAVERTARWGRALIVTGSLLGLGLGVAGCSESDRPLEPPVRFDGNIFGTFYQVTIMDPLTQASLLNWKRALKQSWRALIRRCRPTGMTRS